MAAHSFRQAALPPELEAATAEFRRALVEHLGWSNRAAQAAAEEAAHSRNRNFYKYANEVPSAAIIQGWAAWLGELGLVRHDIHHLTTAAADARWWWVPHDRAPPQPLKGPLPQACALEIAGALAEQYPALPPKTTALLYLCHFNGRIAGECVDSLCMLAGLAAEGVPAHLLHCLALHMAGMGASSPRRQAKASGAAASGIPWPSQAAASPAQVRSILADWRQASGGSWSDAVQAYLDGRTLVEPKQVGPSLKEAQGNILLADGLSVWEIV